MFVFPFWQLNSSAWSSNVLRAYQLQEKLTNDMLPHAFINVFQNHIIWNIISPMNKNRVWKKIIIKLMRMEMELALEANHSWLFILALGPSGFKWVLAYLFILPWPWSIYTTLTLLSIADRKKVSNWLFLVQTSESVKVPAPCTVSAKWRGVASRTPPAPEEPNSCLFPSPSHQPLCCSSWIRWERVGRKGAHSSSGRVLAFTGTLLF